MGNAPVVASVVSRLRDAGTPPHEFRVLLRSLGYLLAHEWTKLLPTRTAGVRTPLGEATFLTLDVDVVVVGVLRAALPMVDGVMDALPSARMGLVAAKRVENETTSEGGGPSGRAFEVQVTTTRIPRARDAAVLVVDPMLATGSTLMRVVQLVAEDAPKRVAILCAIASRFGVERAEREARQLGLPLDVVAGAVDEELNARGYIVPGLGDAGDRAFNT